MRGILIGGSLGASAALFLKTKQGKKFRREVVAKYHQFADAAEAYLHTQKVKAEKVLQRKKAKVKSIVRRQKAKVKSAIRSGKRTKRSSG